MSNAVQRVVWWDDSRTIITADMSLEAGRTSITVDERMAPAFEAAALARTVTHEVALIMDLTHARVFPSGNLLTAFRQLHEALPTNVTRVMVVGSNHRHLMQTTLNLITIVRAVKVQVTFVETMNDAITLLIAPH